MLKSGNNIYLEIENVVETTELLTIQTVSQIYLPIQAALQNADGIEPTGNWTTPYWVWMSESADEFVLVIGPNF